MLFPDVETTLVLRFLNVINHISNHVEIILLTYINVCSNCRDTTSYNFRTLYYVVAKSCSSYPSPCRDQMEECIEGRERGKYECRCRVGFARDRRNYCEGNLAKKFGLNSIIDVSSERSLSLLTFQRKVFAQNVQYLCRFDIERFYIFMCFQLINALVYNELGYLNNRKSTFITSCLFTNRPCKHIFLRYR